MTLNRPSLPFVATAALLLTVSLAEACVDGARAQPREPAKKEGRAQEKHEGHGKHDGHAKHGHLSPDRYRDAEKWAAAFESTDRDAWQRPDEVLKALKLAPDAKVADIGAGTGYFPVRLAKALPKGTVYAVDLEPNMVAYVDARAKREGLTNLRGVVASEDDPKLPEPVDLVLNVNTYHHLEDRPAYFRRVAQKLREGGRVAIIDFRPESKMGPPADHKFSDEKIIRELEEAGFRLAERHAFLPEQHFLVFAPKR